MTPKSTVEVSGLARKSFSQWMSETKSTTYFPRETIQRAAGEAMLITDASLSGFGAILISPLQQLFVTSGKWTSGSHGGTSRASFVP